MCLKKEAEMPDGLPMREARLRPIYVSHPIADLNLQIKI